jgi:hypothetical protein
MEPRVISLAPSGSTAELKPLKGDAGVMHRAASTASLVSDKP